MDSGLGSGSRYERQTRARKQRVQRRLDTVRNGGAKRRLNARGRALLFGGSLVLGLLAAQAVTAVSWWGDSGDEAGTVAVQGLERIQSASVAARVAALRGTGDALDPAAIEREIAAHPWIRQVRVAILPTGTIIAEVEERTPLAVLEVAEGEVAGRRLVDADGVAFAEVDASLALQALTPVEVDALPRLVSDSAPVTPLVQALRVAARAGELTLPGLADATLPHRGLQLRLPTDGPRGYVLSRADARTEVILGEGIDDVLERLDRLERLLAAGLGELRVATSIDLRFAGQAVLRTERASG